MESYHNHGDYEIFLKPREVTALYSSPLEAELLGPEKSQTGKKFRLSVGGLNPDKPIELKYSPNNVLWEEIDIIETRITPGACNRLLSEGRLFEYYTLGKIVFIIQTNSQQI